VSALIIGWKSIARRMGCEESTARRWERDGLIQVARTPRGVAADPDALDATLRRLGQITYPTTDRPGRRSRASLAQYLGRVSHG